MKTKLVLFITLSVGLVRAQTTAVVGFYNLENLYDTIDDPLKSDEEFTPKGSLSYTSVRYHKKIAHLAKAICDIGAYRKIAGADLLGICEVENAGVLEDLVKDSALKNLQYAYVLLEGPDARGVDPALLYKKNSFEVLESKSFAVHLPKDTAYKTRDILLVRGKLFGEDMAIFVNHWPSRRGGELKSRENRNAAARRLRYLADSVERNNTGIKIILMGDLNDDPVNECVKKYIGTFEKVGQEKSGLYYNPFESLFKKGIGSLAYKDSWNLFDQLMFNQNFWIADNKGLRVVEARIHNLVYLRSDYGNFKGYPFRTYSGGIYTGGYSDHFAAYVILKR